MTDSVQIQKILLGVLLIGILGYIGYTYQYRPRVDEIHELELRLAALKKANQVAISLAEHTGDEEFERSLSEYRDRLIQSERLIPSSEEVPSLLDAISNEAHKAGVELALIHPTGASDEDYYTRRTYQVAVLGSYHQIGDFLSRIGSLPRIVTADGVNLTLREESSRNDDPKLYATFLIETYVHPTNPPLGAPGEV